MPEPAARATSPPVPPFVTQLGAFALFPLRGAALACLVVLTLGVLLTGLPGLGWLVDVVLWLAAYKYAFEILRATADGREDAPEVVIATDTGTVVRFLLMQFIFLGIAILLLAMSGPAAALVALLVVTLAQPAATWSLAMDGSLPHALNPATWLSIAGRIGPAYLVPTGLLLLFQLGAGSGEALLAAVLPGTLAAMAARALVLWGLFVTFRLMGYLILQHHERLGWIPEQRVAILARDPDAGLVDAAEAALADGRARDARALLEEDVRTRAVSLPLHALYRRVLQSQGDAAAVSQHARAYLHRLLEEGDMRAALGLLREQLAVERDFAPLQPAHATALLAAADQQGDSRLALALRLALWRTRPNAPDAARWATDAARLLVESLGREAEAAALLDESEACVPDEETLREERARLRGLLARLARRPRAAPLSSRT